MPEHHDLHATASLGDPGALMPAPPDDTVLGHAIDRREDPGLLTGRTRFMADLEHPGALHMTVVRSQLPHGHLRGVDVSEAAAFPGVHSVLTSADLDVRPIRAFGREPHLARPLLAVDRVRFVGEAVAVILTETPAAGVDAAEAVVVDVDPLPAVVDVLDALATDAPLLFPDHRSNVVADSGPTDDDDLFVDADVVVRTELRHHRVAPVTMEPNGAVAVPDDDGGITLWASTQSVFGLRREVAGCLDVDEATVRVRAPAIGGGFGAKGGVYPEQVLAAALARRTGRPVRWIETRSESMLNMTHGRSSVHQVEVGARADGTVVGLRVRVIGDTGAYATRGVFIPSVTQIMASGTYRIPRISVRTTAVVTTTTPTGPYRGAGRPEAAAMCERAMDLVAHELGLDPVEVRRRNLVPADAFPYRSATGAVYDSGDYAAALDAVLESAGHETLRAEQHRRREAAERLQLGIGVATYVEVSGRGSEFGSVRIEDDGTATVVTGSVPHGQGHETVWADIAASVLGLPAESIRVVHSDTAIVPRGTGTFGSRSAQLAGSAVRTASERVLDAARRVVADRLEADVADVAVLGPGGVGVVGTPASAVPWGEIAAHAERAGVDLGVEIDAEQEPTFPSGAHVAVVEVDTETGDTRLRRIVAVDDCGRVINHVLAEGQVHGGLAQGIAQVLFEQVAIDPDGTPLTVGLADYGIPSAADLPAFETAHQETPSPHNPLGAKGIGESGTTGSIAAVWNAVVDALAPWGVRHLDPPFTPERVWRVTGGAPPPRR